MDSVDVIFREGNYDRRRHMPVTIQRGDESKGDYGDPLVWFSCPDMYASSGHPWRLQPDALAALEKAQAELLANDCTMILVDAYRSVDRQKERKTERPDLAVSPDASKHTRGLAVDARLYDPAVGEYFEGQDAATHGDIEYLAEVMGRHGWKRTNPREEWHFEFQG